ncbi:tRNA (adenosine(37)-N6)-threonylcarbamoyltransferase complex dimerization subunit type 1 TsaB [Candidatus Kirkpatrickella diaphorinae]|uniref:tRNA (Adenosine(37)-N6)-threonylcarbamoyltransferase complex dimerization subunit type 1 TsaB n=1 Tax=Candidatus Kirkpatrickella diaphorinae TaxID=2984322 RepID=A0ABY6GHR9_9PROT|nr:tRNA (adenosine(37)-N6)-threonylcarbamoyltransferase complex dimerization subunit type 1 TsaB [Candidatus Kirkpatrickella diaphorinae]UYH50862.1 tRNA (adenosine(37)-N6)-threonylcarbamoyltransferase complex dimerization subunit type 1 TsaB [Candidatus Kirkpatrickella diaphorinae]
MTEVRDPAAVNVRQNLRMLVINAAPAAEAPGGVIAALSGGEVISQCALLGRGASEVMVALLQEVLDAAGWRKNGPDAITVVRGPGSFTGLRASLALAAGLAKAYECPLHGVSIGACYRAETETRDVWTAIRARRNRIFLERPDGTFWAGAPDSVNVPSGQLIVGDASSWLYDRLATTHRFRSDMDQQPSPGAIAAAAQNVPPMESVTPLYVDPPEAKPPLAGLRPAPIP